MYSPRWANLRLRHQTLADDEAVHQVRFYARAGWKLYVTCNCRVTKGMPPISECNGNLPLARLLYNAAHNHAAPFTEGDIARW